MADLVILFSGQTFPTESLGQMALQADTGQLWAYLNGGWNPITGGEAFNVEIPMSIFINGYNVDCKVKQGSMTIKNKLTSKVDTCTMILEDDGDIIYRPGVGQQIDIFDFNSSEKIYSGDISTITQRQEILETNRFVYNISSTDYTKRLHKRLVNKDYSNQLAGDIIKDIIDTYYNEFSYINVEDGPIVDFISFSFIAGDNCIKKIAKLTGYDWFVDPVKDLHFFLPATDFSPYELTEDSSSGHYYNLTIKSDKTNYRNKITLQGSYYTEPFTNDIQIADGVKTTFNLAYEPYGIVEVFVDTGSGFVQKTVGIDNVDVSGFDFVVNKSEKCVRNLDISTLTNGVEIKVTYSKKVKIIVSDEDTQSQTDIQALEGGDGIYEFKLNDDTIATLDAANDRIDAEIADYKDPLISGSFSTDQVGYKAGQIIKIQLPTWGYPDEEYKIQSVSISPQTAQGVGQRAYVRYVVTFQSFERSFDQFLLSLYNNSTNREIVVQGDEKLVT